MALFEPVSGALLRSQSVPVVTACGCILQLFSVFACPEPDGIKHDSTVRSSLEGESWPQFVLFVDDGDFLVFVRLTVTIDTDSDLPLAVLNDQIDPFTELHG